MLTLMMSLPIAIMFFSLSLWRGNKNKKFFKGKGVNYSEEAFNYGNRRFGELSFYFSLIAIVFSLSITIFTIGSERLLQLKIGAIEIALLIIFIVVIPMIKVKKEIKEKFYKKK